MTMDPVRRAAKPVMLRLLFVVHDAQGRSDEAPPASSHPQDCLVQLVG